MRLHLSWIAIFALSCGGGLTGSSHHTKSFPQKFADTKPGDTASERHRREDIAKILPAVKRLVDEDAKAFPSLSIGVIVGEDMVWTGNYGVRDDKAKDPVTADTVFRIGSLTKVLAGVGLMQLRDAGKVIFDEPLVRLIPELATIVYPTRDSPHITLRHLVTHSSGLDQDGGLAMGNDPITEAQLLGAVSKEVLWFAPGSRTAYSNIAMALAGTVIARASGASFQAYLLRKVFLPIGMTATVWERSAVPADKLATGHKHSNDGFVPSGEHFQLGAAGTMGGLYSSLNDLAKFVSFELTAWPTRDAPDDGPLHRATLRETQMPFGPSSGGALFGVNWSIFEDNDLGYMLFHNGTTGDYSATIIMLPHRQIAIVALASAGNYQALDMLARKTLGLVASVAPEPEPVLGTPVSTALVHVLGLLEKADAEDIKQVFSARFLSSGTPEDIKQTFEKVGKTLGHCKSHRAIRVTSATEAVVRVECERGAADLQIETGAEAPYLIESLQLQPAKQ